VSQAAVRFRILLSAHRELAAQLLLGVTAIVSPVVSRPVRGGDPGGPELPVDVGQRGR
jgi:hypothetical protein